MKGHRQTGRRPMIAYTDPPNQLKRFFSIIDYKIHFDKTMHLTVMGLPPHLVWVAHALGPWWSTNNSTYFLGIK